jgi:hypothetical protein
MYNAAPEARIGVSYRLTVDIEKGTHQYISIGDLGDFAWHTAVLDINAGTLGTTLNATSSVVANGTDRYLFSIDYTRTNGGALNPIICFVAASTTTQCASFTAAGTETVKVYSAQIRRTSTQPTYVATTAAPVYGSFTGRRGLVFDGSSDRMGSTSLFSDIWTNSVKEVFAVAVPGESSMVNANILTTASHYAAIEIGTAYPALYNYDGSGDRAEDTAYSRGTPYVLHGRHAGGSIYYSKDNGVEISASSGNTTNTTDTLSLGARSASEYWTGDILEVVTFNRTLQPSVRDRIISGLRIKHGI